MTPFSAVEVFSATMARDREVLGERLTEWLLQLVDRVLTQTSDDEYHCFTVTLFLAGDTAAYLAEWLQLREGAGRRDSQSAAPRWTPAIRPLMVASEAAIAFRAPERATSRLGELFPSKPSVAFGRFSGVRVWPDRGVHRGAAGLGEVKA